jgi:hypothetical protein
MTIKAIKTRRTPEEIRFWQEIRSSNAARPHKNKAKYVRKPKHTKDMYV